MSETVPKICELLVYFAILSVCNMCFCPFNQNIKQNVEFLFFFLDRSYLSSIFSPPPKYIGMGKSGHKTLKARAAQKTMFQISFISSVE